MHNVTRTSFLALGFLIASRAQAQTFSGPHVEAVVGASHDSRVEINRRLNDSSLVYGLGGGYDVRTGQVVIGAIGEVSGTTNKNCGTYDVAGAALSPSLAGRLCFREQRSLFAGARLGYVAGDHTLAYVLSGYENIRSKVSFDGAQNGVDASKDEHSTEGGFRVGAGLEHAISDHVFVKAEYRYSWTGDHDPSSQRHQLVSGIGLRF